MIRKSFGIVIPCYNEAEGLPRLLLQCAHLAQTNSIQFVFVDNGSSDGSHEILHKFQEPNFEILTLPTNQGYGGGILAGLALLTTDYVGWTHADMQTDLGESLNLEAFPEFEFFKGVRKGRKLSERILSRGMSIFCSALFGLNLPEINAQPTIMKREVYLKWKNPPRDFSLDLYALAFASNQKIQIVRREFEFKNRVSGSSTWNFGVKSQYLMVVRTLKYAVALRREGLK